MGVNMWAVSKLIQARITRRIRALFFALLIGFGLVIPATAKTFEIKSENFTFVGEISEKNGRALVEDLEVYRATVLALLGVEGVTKELRPVQIYGIKGYQALSKFADRQGAAGLYTVTDAGPIYLMDTSGGVRRTDEARHIALHEYAHHILSRYTLQLYPRWYNEGFAEYFSTYFQEDGIINIGDPIKINSDSQSLNDWFDMDVFLGAVTQYPYAPGSRRGRAFYDQAWLSVHYIMNDAEMSKNFGIYINAINEGVDPLRAFEDSFNITPDAFGKIIRSYLRTNRFSVMQFTRTRKFEVGSITVRELEKSEAKIAMQLGRINFSRGKKKLQNSIRKILTSEQKKVDNPANALSGLAQIDGANGKYEDAITRSKLAIDKDPSNTLAHYTHGDAYFHRFYTMTDDEQKQSGDMLLAIDFFEKHLQLDPTHPTSNTHYIEALLYDSLLRGSMQLDNVASRKNQINKTVDFLLSYYRNPHEAMVQLMAVQTLWQLGDRDKACKYHKRMKFGYTLSVKGNDISDGWFRELNLNCPA